MITQEIILFILSILFGIFVYWRESKNNFLYRTINKITHSKEQQMSINNKKGFFFMQPFLVRLIYVVLFVLACYLISKILLSFLNLRIGNFITIIVGMMAGTYFASLIVFANNKMEDGQDIIEDTLEKGKEMLKDLTKKDEKIVKDKTEKPKEKIKKEIKETKKSSARERLKDKGYM